MSFRIWVSVWTSSADSNFFYIIIKTQKDGAWFQISIKVQSFLKHCVKWRSCKTLYWTLERWFQKRLTTFLYIKYIWACLVFFDDFENEKKFEGLTCNSNLKRYLINHSSPTPQTLLLIHIESKSQKSFLSPSQWFEIFL